MGVLMCLMSLGFFVVFVCDLLFCVFVFIMFLFYEGVGGFL